MQQRLGLCRTLLHDPERSSSTSRSTRSTRRGGAARARARRAARARTLLRRHARPGARRRSGERGSRSHEATSPTSRRWRGRTCCSSCGRATRFPRCSSSWSRRSSSSTSRCPTALGSRRRSGCSGCDRSSRRCSALDARLRPRARAGAVGRARARALDRSAIWLCEGARRARLPRIAEADRTAGLRAFFSPGRRDHRGAGRARRPRHLRVGTLLGAMAAAGRARELLLPLLFLPLAIPIVVGGVGASVVRRAGRYLGFLALTTRSSAARPWSLRTTRTVAAGDGKRPRRARQGGVARACTRPHRDQRAEEGRRSPRARRGQPEQVDEQTLSTTEPVGLRFVCGLNWLSDQTVLRARDQSVRNADLRSTSAPRRRY